MGQTWVFQTRFKKKSDRLLNISQTTVEHQLFSAKDGIWPFFPSTFYFQVFVYFSNGVAKN